MTHALSSRDFKEHTHRVVDTSSEKAYTRRQAERKKICLLLGERVREEEERKREREIETERTDREIVKESARNRETVYYF